MLGVLMPEAAVYENHFPPCTEDQIRLSGKILGVEAEAEAEAVSESGQSSISGFALVERIAAILWDRSALERLLFLFYMDCDELIF
jgi:hypothetical protein